MVCWSEGNRIPLSEYYFTKCLTNICTNILLQQLILNCKYNWVLVNFNLKSFLNKPRVKISPLLKVGCQASLSVQHYLWVAAGEELKLMNM